jgi:hypothetical protein
VIPAGRAIVLVPLMLWTSIVRAQSNPWERHVEHQLERATQRLSREGYVRPQHAQVGLLNTEESESFTLTLPSGPAYALLGVCDNDCTSLHLIVLNETKNYEVAAARTADEASVVQLTPRNTARYHVRVEMTSCNMNPCWYGIAVFQKRHLNRRLDAKTPSGSQE